jgi:Zn-dependent protease
MSRQDFDFAHVWLYLFRHVTTTETILFVAPVLLFSVIAHEYAHGYAAMRQGDPTAQMLGRLTWNPLKHIDPFLTIVMPLMMYWAWGTFLGGAKPVPVNPRNYRNFRRGDIIVSLAGVAVNFGLAFICTALIALFGFLANIIPVIEPSVGILQVMMVFGIQINLGLLMFNLLPIPPLDGSHVMKYLLPPAWSLQYQRLGFLGIIILIVIVKAAPGFLAWWFGPADYLSRGLRLSVRRLFTPTFYSWVS